jgi:hypothetical protein
MIGRRIVSVDRLWGRRPLKLRRTPSSSDISYTPHPLPGDDAGAGAPPGQFGEGGARARGRERTRTTLEKGRRRQEHTAHIRLSPPPPPPPPSPGSLPSPPGIGPEAVSGPRLGRTDHQGEVGATWWGGHGRFLPGACRCASMLGAGVGWI